MKLIIGCVISDSDSFIKDRHKVKEKKDIMITINAIGDTCPIPVVKTKKAIEKLEKPDTVETLVDNEIAVENLKKMASQMGFAVSDSKINSGYSVKITVDDIDKINDNKMSATNAKATSEAKANSIKTGADDMVSCNIKNSGEKVVVIKSDLWVMVITNLERCLSKALSMHFRSRTNCHRQCFFITAVQRLQVKALSR